MTIPRHEAEAIALSLVAGKGVMIRDTHGIGAPAPGWIVQITSEDVLVGLADGRPVRVDRSTGYVLQAGDHDRWQITHDRWQITAPAPPGSEEYGDLLIRQGELQAKRERILRELDVVGAVLETADAVAGGTSTEEQR